MAEHTSRTPAYADARERYRLDARIATGGMGEVWRATDTVLDRLVAVKLLRQEHADDPVFRSRFESEAQHAASLHDPGIAQVFDFGTGDHEHPPFLVMELVDGKPLSAILRPGQPMDPAAAGRLLAAAGDALGVAHRQGIVHRDVKPANILVTAERQVKLTDFGIARAADGATLTRTGEVLGTPQYISPEQAEGRPTTPASDVYALGAVGYECLVGQRPFDADTPVAVAIAHLRQPVPQLPSTVPAPLADVVRRALAKPPEERYPDGTAFAAAIREAADSPAPVPAPMPAPVTATDDAGSTRVMAAPVAAEAVAAGPGPVGGWARRVPIPVWAAAGVLVLVVAVAAVASVTTGGGGSSPAGDTSSHTPRTSTPSSTPTSLTSSPTSSLTSSLTSSPTSSPTGPTPGGEHGGKGHGHDHGHGKGDK